MSPRTEKAYCGWVKRYLRFVRRDPRTVGAPAVSAFLSHLATDRDVAASTQNQALAALLFLYGEVLGIQLEAVENLVRAKRPKRLPVVLTHTEVRAVFREMTGVTGMLTRLLYGSGLRIDECITLRVNNLDLQRREIVVQRQG
ncbi:MAG: phage integrase N-terminal SAM-like domain-containing protein [Myxococcales bacterium]|nr:phage integrase N-terminal SAM-like domain-containing protein [Myxococcales bacterium]